MAAEYAQSDQFRGARIHLCDLAGLEIRDCEVSGLKIVDCYGSDVYLGGDFERLVVNDVDVTAYVEAELDRPFIRYIAPVHGALLAYSGRPLG
ncbi:hypothetical protein [Streptosporangium sp. H16]|uniref:hypothetical protein n=1 Tax=Streptosporangium sp. H16 TaxID=3444184 RepID=UPI003F7A8E7F